MPKPKRPDGGRMRKGPLSDQERALIRSYTAPGPSQMTPREVAKLLNRSEGVVCKYIRENLAAADVKQALPPVVDKEQIKHSLKRNARWNLLKERFNYRELAFFEQQYAEYVEQFREDVLGTEESQLFQLIELDIMMNRNRAAAKRIRDEAQAAAEELEALPRPADRDDAQKARSRELKSDMSELAAAEAAKTTEFLKLKESHEGVLEGLKATRAQRVNRPEHFKETFLDVIRRLQDERTADPEGRRMEFDRRAAEKEAARLSQWHTFEDGKLDQPLLTAETALSDDDAGGAPGQKKPPQAPAVSQPNLPSPPVLRDSPGPTND